VIGKFGVIQEYLSNLLSYSPDIQHYSDVCRYSDVYSGVTQILYSDIWCYPDFRRISLPGISLFIFIYLFVYSIYSGIQIFGYLVLFDVSMGWLRFVGSFKL